MPCGDLGSLLLPSRREGRGWNCNASSNSNDLSNPNSTVRRIERAGHPEVKSTYGLLTGYNVAGSAISYRSVMHRFFFHLHDELVVYDDEGLELPDAEAALARAEHEARALAAEEVKSGTLHLDYRIVVVRAPDEVIGTVTFREVVRVEG